MRYSIIIPLYNRPEEIDELLSSLSKQDFFALSSNKSEAEVVVVEDGSTVDSKTIVESYGDKLSIKYLTQTNSGPAVARTFGAKCSSGEWLLFLDSDTVLPTGWLSAINCQLSIVNCKLFGGPDRASDDFTPIQKAINYSMTSFFTTGGIRGGKVSAEKFHPRSFNMGVRRDYFEQVSGFSTMRFGEDIDLSIRLIESGAKSALFTDAWVYHKRRVDFRKFFRQVRASGGARIALTRKHKGSLKLVHLLPAAFTIFVVLSVVGSAFCQYAMLPLALWAGLIVVDSTIKNGGIEIGILSVWASFVQLTGYGIGFLVALFGGGKRTDKNFYK